MSISKTAFVYFIVVEQIVSGGFIYQAVQYNDWWVGLVVLGCVLAILLLLIINAILIGDWDKEKADGH